MRTQCNSRYAGYGTSLAIYEDEDSYRDLKVAVRLPSDAAAEEGYKSLHGPVITYRLGDERDGR